MTLKEWTEAHPNATLDGLVLRIPKGAEGITEIPKRELAIRSMWGMPPDRIGLWMMLPEDFRQGHGRTYPLMGLTPDQVMSWEVVEPHEAEAGP